MAIHNELGKTGEQHAADWLTTKGYTILHRNWRYSHYEIDIIAQKGKKTNFIEVKARSTDKFGHPEEAVTKKKFKHLQRAADEYLQQHKDIKWIQYDVLSIIVNTKETTYFLLEDVFL